MINLNVLEFPEDPQLLKTEMGDCGLQLSVIHKFDKKFREKRNEMFNEWFAKQLQNKNFPQQDIYKLIYNPATTLIDQ